MFGKLLIIIGLVSAGLLLVLLNITTPSGSGAGIILIVFLLGYVVTLVITTFTIWIINRTVLRIGAGIFRQRSGEKISVRKSYYYASVIALAPVILVSLQSVGGAGLYEVGLVLLFVVLGCIYIARRTA